MLATGISSRDLEERASQALRRLQSVKDASIRAFAQSFIGGLEMDGEADFFRKLRCLQHQQLAVQASFCSSLAGGGEPRGGYLAKKRTKQRARTVLEAVHASANYQRQLVMLVALEECYMQDKVAALPLIFNLVESRASATRGPDSQGLFDAYSAFMDATESKFSFMANSPSILPRRATGLAADLALLGEPAPRAVLAEYVKSNSTSFLVRGPKSDRVLSSIARRLDPASLQLIRLALAQAYDRLQAAQLDQRAMMGVLKQVAGAAVLSLSATAGDALPDAAIDTIISATLRQN